MSGPSVAALGGDLTTLLDHLAEVDTRIQALDPAWRGLSSVAIGAVASATPAIDTTGSEGQGTGDTFASTLSSAAGSIALAMSRAPGTESRAPRTGVTAVPANLILGQPVAGASVSQGYGPTDLAIEPSAVVDGVRYAHFHDGIDLAAPLGTPVMAAASGVVVAAGRLSDGAVVVRIHHDDGSETAYGHLAPDLSVSVGDHVTAGQKIGAVGLTGRTTGPHVHFELTVNGQTIDPAPWLAAGCLPGASATFAGAPDSVAMTSAQAFAAAAASIPYAREIGSAAQAAGVDPLLLGSLVRAESGFRSDAVSSAGALGLAQLMPATARSMGVSNPFDPAQNVSAAARYLASNLRLYGRVDLALAAYQAGKGAVSQAGGIPDSPVTLQYVARILGYWAGYLESAGSTGAAGAAAPPGSITFTGAAA